MAVSAPPEAKLFYTRAASFEQLMQFSLVPYDDTDDWTPRLVIRRRQSDSSAALVTITGTWVVAATPANGGLASFVMTATQTGGLPATGAAYYVDLIDANGVIHRALMGAMGATD